ncbi:nucleoside phosphorylase domain-containing protein, partial [Cercophora newfieldiana]
QPPRLLRSAVSNLRSIYEDRGHTIDATIQNIVIKNPRLRKYAWPPPNLDVLFRPEAMHPPNDSRPCAQAGCGTHDPSRVVYRQPRQANESLTVVHYGLIASADQLMKDAFMRDRLVWEKGVKCFEMEAAGLMNHFPCLVIRGISDYSDTHKNDEWQGYAAMAAAAYAKELLLQIPLEQVETQAPV